MRLALLSSAVVVAVVPMVPRKRTVVAPDLTNMPLTLVKASARVVSLVQAALSSNVTVPELP